MVADHQGVRDQGGLNRSAPARAEVADGYNTANDQMLARSHSRRPRDPKRQLRSKSGSIETAALQQLSEHGLRGEIDVLHLSDRWVVLQS
jgi:hypothetical protein